MSAPTPQPQPDALTVIYPNGWTPEQYWDWVEEGRKVTLQYTEARHRYRGS